MLHIQQLNGQVGDHNKKKLILHDFSLHIRPGEMHAIMGPNGSGKSTLAYTLAGRSGYEVVSGTVQFLNQDLLALDAHQRALAGLFLAFQYPVTIPGISTIQFLRMTVNAVRQAQQLPPYEAIELMGLAREQLAKVGMDEQFLFRHVNDGFSGGEKKRLDMLHMALIQPKLAILDETDSGLDIDALQAVAEGINEQRRDDNAFLVITHYQRLLQYLKPDHVHVMVAGQIVASGGPELALQLEKQGYHSLASHQQGNL